MITINRFKSLASLTVLAVAAGAGNIASAQSIQSLSLQGNDVAQIVCPTGMAPALHLDIVRCQTDCKLVVTSSMVETCSDQGGCSDTYYSDFVLINPISKQALVKSSSSPDGQKEAIRQIKADFVQECPIVTVVNQ